MFERLALGPLAVDAKVEEGGQLVPLGVAVEFHPGITHSLQPMVLEQALREFVRLNAGTVTRGGHPTHFCGWLPGWTIQTSRGVVIGLRIAFIDTEEGGEESGEAAQ